MRTFPDEEERSAAIQANLREHFEYCEQLYKYWIEAEKDEWVEKAEVNTRVGLVVGILHVQAFRLYRSIIELCRRGEAFSARILSRSFYETVLALLFVLKPKVYIRLEPMTKSGIRKTDADGRPATFARAIESKKAKSTDRLPSEFRALLYLANRFIGLQEFESKCRTTLGLKNIYRRTKVRVDPNEIAQIENEIGVEWSYVLRNGNRSYSGLSIRSMAKALSRPMLKWYDTVYSFHSKDVHAANALDHYELIDAVTRSGELVAVSSDHDVTQALKAAAMNLRAVMKIMEEYIGFGPGNPSAIAHFDREYDRIFKVKT